MDNNHQFSPQFARQTDMSGGEPLLDSEAANIYVSALTAKVAINLFFCYEISYSLKSSLI
jgi:hypothetical protein